MCLVRYSPAGSKNHNKFAEGEIVVANNPVLSICIPTYKREYLVEQLLKSIYDQGCDHELFEVVITDNSETDETKELIETQYKQVDNLHYKKVTCKGFMNSIEALKFGKGQFLKLQNDYSLFTSGSLRKMIDLVIKHQKSRPVIFFQLSGGVRQQKVCTTMNHFMKHIRVLSTWSSAFSIWKEDFDEIMKSGIEPNYMYPHTTLLFAESYKNQYIIDSYEYCINKEPKKKGGYNLVDNFIRIYLGMVKNQLLNPGHISQKTYNSIEDDSIRFVAQWRHTCENDRENRYTFTFENQEEIIRKTCGEGSLKKFWRYYRLEPINTLIRRIKRKFVRLMLCISRHR